MPFWEELFEKGVLKNAVSALTYVRKMLCMEQQLTGNSSEKIPHLVQVAVDGSCHAIFVECLVPIIQG